MLFRLLARLRHGSPERRVLKGGAVKLYWASKEPNFGDVVSPLIVSHMTGMPIMLAKGSEHGKLLAVGSIISIARSGDVIWGSGLISEDVPIRSANLEVCAVRGPLTRQRLIHRGVHCPEIYGDPAIFLPELFRRESLDPLPRTKLGIVPHHLDYKVIKQNDPSVRVIDVLQAPQRVIVEILACDRIVSSSLHGVIVAEAYGVPADWMELSGNVIGGGFKFRDYYLGTGREPITPLGLDTMFADREWIKPAFNTEGMRNAFPIGKSLNK